MRCGTENKGTGSKAARSIRGICPLDFIPTHRLSAARHRLPRHDPDVSPLKTEDGPRTQEQRAQDTRTAAGRGSGKGIMFALGGRWGREGREVGCNLTKSTSIRKGSMCLKPIK